MAKARLEGILDINNKPFTKGMNDAVAKAKTSSKQMTGAFAGIGKRLGASASGLFAGALSVGALTAGVRGIGNIASKIKDLSDSVNVSTDTFQDYSFAVTQAGGSEESLVKGLAALIAKSQDAQDGNEKTIATFNRLGISVEKLEGMTPDQILLRVADALKKSGADGKTTADVMELLGSKVALKLIPALRVGSEEFLNVGRSARKMTEETINNIEAMGDAWDKWKRNLAGDIANKFVGVKEGFKQGVSFWDGFKSAMGIEDGDVWGPKEIKTGAVTAAELQKAAAANNARKAKAEAEEWMPPVKPYVEPSRFGANGLSNNAIGFNSGLKGASMTSAGKFATAFTPSLQSDLSRGGRTMLGEGRGVGMTGDAHGVVRRGDAARRKSEAAEAAKRDADDPAYATATNTAALARVWGATGTSK